MSYRNLTRAVAALAGTGFLFVASAATASPPYEKVHGERYDRHGGHGRGHGYARGPACRTVYTFGHHGTRKVIICDGPPARHVGPPPWAPAYGYRDGYRGDHREDHRTWRPKHHERRRIYWNRQAPWHGAAYPSVATGGACNSTLLSGVVGGVSGALIGSQVGGGSGRAVATAAGTLIGALAGLGVGESLDRACIGQALEYAPDGGTVHWSGRQGPPQPWQATPTATWQGEDGRYCREFISTATVGGEPQQVYGRACRQPDGSWEIVS